MVDGSRGVVECPDGYLWVLEQDGRVVVRTFKTGDGDGEIVVEDGQGANIIGGARDGDRVFLGDRNGFVRCYDGRRRELIRSVMAHSDGIACMATSRNVVVTAGRCDKTLKVFNGSSGVVVHTLDLEFSGVSALCVGRGNVLVGSDDGKLYSVTAEKSNTILQLPNSPRIETMCTVPTSPSRVWLGLSTGNVVLLRRGTISFSSRAHAGPVTSLCSVSRKLVCSAGIDSQICIWDASRLPPRLLHTTSRLLPASLSPTSLSIGTTSIIERRRMWIASAGTTRAWSLSTRSKNSKLAQMIDTLGSNKLLKRFLNQTEDLHRLRQQLKRKGQHSKLPSPIPPRQRQKEKKKDEAEKKLHGDSVVFGVVDGRLLRKQSYRRRRRFRSGFPHFLFSFSGSPWVFPHSDDEVEQFRGRIASLEMELDEARGDLRRKDAEVMSARKISRRRLRCGREGGGETLGGRSVLPPRTWDACRSSSSSQSDGGGDRKEVGGGGGGGRETNVERELEAAVELIREMDRAARRSDVRLERLTTLLTQRSRSLAEKNRDLVRVNLTLAECQDRVASTQEELGTVLQRAKDILEERRVEESSLRGRLDAITR